MIGQTINVGAVGTISTEAFKINYVQAVASAAGLIVILTDTAGNIFFEGRNGTGVNGVELSMNGQEVNGIKCATFTNCGRLIIGVERIIN